jgi:probable F420-dependent oxidoreductase
MREIKFGVHLITTDFPSTLAAAKHAEELGFFSVSMGDHLLSAFRRGGPAPKLEVYSTLSALSVLTSRIRLAPMVTAVTFRNPALLAKMVSTIDHISGGRFIAGLGSGWMQREFEAYGYPFPGADERLAQLAEAIQVLKAMWTEEEPVFAGRYFSINKAHNLPHPTRKPHPPILVGGFGTKLIEVAARHADIVNLIPPIQGGKLRPLGILHFGKPELQTRIALLRRRAQAAGRAADAVEISGFATARLKAGKSEADRMVGDLARLMQFSDAQAARECPGLLVGTPQEVRRTIGSMVEEFGMTYFVLTFLTPESMDLFAGEVMPEFKS